MKNAIQAMCAAAIVAALGTTAVADVGSTFDSGKDGWSIFGDASLFWDSSGGNPGGRLRMEEQPAGSLFGLSAPGKFLGDQSAMEDGSLSYDFLRISGTGSKLSTWGYVTITGTNADSALIDLGNPPETAGVWTHWSTNLTAATWGKSESQWSAILADVASITVRTEMITGDESSAFDNFQLTAAAIPVPPAVVLAAIGLGLVVRKQKTLQARNTA